MTIPYCMRLVALTIYNLPSWLCMKTSYLILTLLTLRAYASEQGLRLSLHVKKKFKVYEGREKPKMLDIDICCRRHIHFKRTWSLMEKLKKKKNPPNEYTMIDILSQLQRITENDHIEQACVFWRKKMETKSVWTGQRKLFSLNCCTGWIKCLSII